MERNEALKMEDPMKSSYLMDGFFGNNSYSNSFLGYNGDEGEKGTLGFMELLGMQDFVGSASLFDMSQANDKTPSSEVVNTPATPNYSSISSESSGAPPNELQSKALASYDKEKEEEEERPQKNTKKQLKPKKTSQKKQRVPRFAFMTKSDVDHLEDGYRWRKYGQKAVKNSPFPRSYYRCTSASCNVKKRVERSFNDPTIVVTTYEGQHIHQSPMMMPRNSNSLELQSNFTFSTDRVINPFAHQMPMFDQPRMIINSNSIDANDQQLQMRRFGSQYSGGTDAGLLRDNGLLQDIVPSVIRN